MPEQIQLEAELMSRSSTLVGIYAMSVHPHTTFVHDDDDNTAAYNTT